MTKRIQHTKDTLQTNADDQNSCLGRCDPQIRHQKGRMVSHKEFHHKEEEACEESEPKMHQDDNKFFKYLN